MAWKRLALLQVAGETDEIQNKMATVFGYATLEKETDPHDQANQKKSSGGQPSSQPENEKKKKPKRSPARFLRVNKIQRIMEQHDKPPEYLHNPAMLLGHQKETSQKAKVGYDFANPTALLTPSQLSPFLLNGIGRQRLGKRLDHRRLTKQIENGKPLQKLPCLSQQRWPQQLLIIVDPGTYLEPYWIDFARIVEQMKSTLGQESVEAISFDEESLDKKVSYCIAWPPEDTDEYHQWQPPPADISLLLLSDLGVTDARGLMSVRWRRFLKPLQQQGSCFLTLSPVSKSPTNPLFCRDLKPTPFNDYQSLPRHPYRHGFTLQVAKSATIEQALTLLSPLPVVDAGLLRQLRKAFQWGGSELESIIWNHPDIRQIGLGIRLRKTIGKKYRQQYEQNIAGTPIAKRLWEIVLKHHEDTFTGLKQLEKLNQCVLEGQSNTEMKDYLQRISATVSQGDKDSKKNKALLMQCRTILASMPESIWRSDQDDIAYDLYALVHEDEIKAGKWPDSPEQGFNPSRLQWKLDEKNRAQHENWQIRQTGDEGQFIVLREKAQREKNADVLPAPVISIESTKKISPRLQQASLQESSKASSQVNGVTFLKEGAETQFAQKNSIITIESTHHWLELEAISKPSWAHRIWQDKTGVLASILWGGNEYTIPWRVSESLVKSYWDWSAPFGEDEYGLYADLTVKKSTQRFRWVEPGTFIMGSPEDEAGRFNDEAQHQVTLTQGYWLAETAVTQVFWQAIMGENPSYFNKQKTSLSSTNHHPVESVSWNDCQAFIKKLNDYSPTLDCRLPTEAEWEYACRAGSDDAFNFTGELDINQVNYSGKFDEAGYVDEALQRTAEVKSYTCNAWGLYEMHGNVWEWCQDYWSEDLGKEPLTDPQGPEEGTQRVLRGGSWDNDGRYVRSAIRYNNSPDGRYYFIGVRLALGQPSLSKHNYSIESSGHGIRADSREPQAATVSTEAGAAEIERKDRKK